MAILRRRGVKPIGFGIWTQPELVSLEIVRGIGGDREAARVAVAHAVDDLIRRAQALGGSMEYVHGVGAKLAHAQEAVTVKLPALLADTEASDTAPADELAVTPKEVSALMAAARLAAIVLTVSFIPNGTP